MCKCGFCCWPDTDFNQCVFIYSRIVSVIKRHVTKKGRLITLFVHWLNRWKLRPSFFFRTIYIFLSLLYVVSYNQMRVIHTIECVPGYCVLYLIYKVSMFYMQSVPRRVNQKESRLLGILRQCKDSWEICVMTHTVPSFHRFIVSAKW